MEGFDFTKIISVVVFAAIYILLQWRSSKGAPKSVGDEGVEILEEFDFETFERESQPTPRPQTSRVESRATTPRVAVSPRVEELATSEQSHESSKVEFDLRKAVIMSEILTPKFKDE